MALMVYNAPKWFLALRQAWLTVVGGFPSVDHIILREGICFVEVTVESTTYVCQVGQKVTEELVTLNIQLSWYQIQGCVC